MLVLFFHHYCGVRWTRCHFKPTMLAPNPAEVKTRQVWAEKEKKAEQAPKLLILTQLVSGLATRRTGTRTWHATWLPATLHCKLPLLWPAWRAAPWQGVAWCFLKPGLFLEDKKKKKKKKAAACRHLCCAAFAVSCLMFVVIRKSMSRK